ncbi:MAG: helix-turn-helix transcriptional regulator [Acidobacteriia bacterium]|nr:helix-turn-helix transcriptional regulator [Terriglobia bacterium]MYG03936.1 helix-turn-helix transcriptional regulator [Terriglobia bacterium]
MSGPEIIQVIQDALHRQGSNPSRFAKENGFSVNAIRYILEGRPPSSRRLAEVCEALGLEFYVGPPRVPEGKRIDVRELANELDRLAIEARRIADDVEGAPAEIDQNVLYVSAPRYEVQAAAGSGEEVLDESVKGYLGFNKTWLRERNLSASNLAVIEVRGDSMEPTLHDGDSVLLDMRSPQLKDGGIYTLRRGGELLVKRLRRQGASWLIVSDNLSYAVESLDENVDVLGRVVWLGRTFADGA